MFNRSLLLVLFVLFIFLKIDAVQAETKINSMISTDSKISGTAEPNQKLMLLHKGEWLNTTVSQDGAFTFSLSSSVGDDVLMLKSQQEDGIFRETQKIAPTDIAKLPPIYKGIQQKNWVFASPIPNATISALINGTVYSAQGELRVPVTDPTTALIYSNYNGMKSTTVEISLNKTYQVPFNLDSSQLSFNHFKGTTLPNIAVNIAYTGENHLPYTQYAVSDRNGAFDVLLDYPFESRINATFKIYLPQFSESNLLPDSLTKTYSLPFPIADALKPVHLTPTILHKNYSITGVTFKNAEVKIVSGDTSKACSVDSSNGYFNCLNSFDSSTVRLVASINQKEIWNESLKVYPVESEYQDRTIKNFYPTSNTDILEGSISMRFAKLKIEYLANDGSESFSMWTTTDENGRFKINFPKTAGGRLTFKASPNPNRENFIDFGQVKIEDVRPVPIPKVIYTDLNETNGSLQVNVGSMKNTTLEAKAIVYRQDGSFSVVGYSSYYLNQNSNYTSVQPLKLNNGDRLVVQSFSNNGAKSMPVEQVINLPIIDSLSDVSTIVKGKTSSLEPISITLHSKKKSDNKLVSSTSNTTGEFNIDYSKELKETYYPQNMIFKKSDSFTIISTLSIKDTIAPILEVLPLTNDSSELSYILKPDLIKGIDCTSITAKIYYKNGTIQEKVDDNFSEMKSYYNLSFNDYRSRSFLYNLSFSTVDKIELAAIDSFGNKTISNTIKPVDITYPNPAQVDIPLAEDTHVTGKAEKDTKIEVTINQKNFTAETDSKGRFDVTVDKLIYNELITVDVFELESGNKSPRTMTKRALGIKNVDVRPDRKALRFISNSHSDDNFKILISDGKTIQNAVVYSSKTEIKLNNFLKNHASLQISVLTGSGRIVTEKMYKFSDTIPPSKPTNVSFSNEDNHYALYGRAEEYATFELLENDKLVKKMKMPDYEDFGFHLDSELDIDIRSKWTVRLTDIFGNSASYPVYPKDVRAPAKPRVVSITNNAKIVQGMINEYATVYLKWNGKTYRTTTDDSGNFALSIKPLSKDTTVTAYAVDLSGNKSPLFTTKVLGVLQLTGSTVTSKSTSISGKGTPGATITLYKGSKKLGSATVLKNGTYTLKFSRQSSGSGLTLEAKKATYKTKELTLTVKK